MSSTDSTEFSPLDNAACRILTVSPSLSCALDLVDRVKALRKAGRTTEVSTSSQTVAHEPEPKIQGPGLGESTRIPWTISNKYYSADVHFAAHTVTGLAPYMVRNVPAVIFVWPKGEAYKHHVERLAGDMSGYEPEVSLAVRVPPLGTVVTDGEDEVEEDADLDEFLSSNGFEFIDATESLVPEEESRLLSEGIPGLPRVLDALSTIMWSSMQAHAKPQSSELPGPARRDFDWAQNSLDEIPPVSKLTPSRNRQQEIEELARWLEEDDGVSQHDPWRPADSTVMSASPTGVDAPDFPDGAKEFGFDDDFTVFVSAPPVTDMKAYEDDDGDGEDSFDSPTRLGLPDSSPLYLSLGSALDLQEVDGGKTEPVDDNDDDDDDDGDEDVMPTDAEIAEVRSRIFGEPVRSKADDADSLDAGDADEYDMAPFDLSRVMNALEGMKAEIASMEDEGEKRKAAASVAISLVYGLQANNSNHEV